MATRTRQIASILSGSQNGGGFSNARAAMMMRADKRKKLEAIGWAVGDAQDFLQLSPEESAYIEMKLALGHSLKSRRSQQHLSQMELAKRVKSSQSRIAKMEAGDPSVSIDLLVKSLLALGASPEEVAQAIYSGDSRAA